MEIASIIFMIVKAIMVNGPKIIEKFKGFNPDKEEDQEKITKWFYESIDNLKTKDWDEIE